jgi:hypothetical protein
MEVGDLKHNGGPGSDKARRSGRRGAPYKLKILALMRRSLGFDLLGGELV